MYFDAKAKGNANPNILLIHRPEMATMIEGRNAQITAQDPKVMADIKSGQLAVDPNPSYALQAWGQIRDPKTGQKTILELGWASSERGLNGADYPFAINKGMDPTAEPRSPWSVITKSKDDIVPAMDKQGISHFWTSLDTLRSVKETKSSVKNNDPSSFMALLFDDAHWQKSIADQGKLNAANTPSSIAANIAEVNSTLNVKKQRAAIAKVRDQIQKPASQMLPDIIATRTDSIEQPIDSLDALKSVERGDIITQTNFHRSVVKEDGSSDVLTRKGIVIAKSKKTNGVLVKFEPTENWGSGKLGNGSEQWLNENDLRKNNYDKFTVSTPSNSVKQPDPTVSISNNATKALLGNIEDALASKTSAELKQAFKEKMGIELSDEQATTLWNNREQLAVKDALKVVQDAYNSGNMDIATRTMAKFASQYLKSDAYAANPVARVFPDLKVVGGMKPEVPPERMPPSASVPIMITKKMESDLLSRGYTADDIYKMRPDEAHKILSEPPDFLKTDAQLAETKVKLKGNSPYIAKDQIKSDLANKYIGKGQQGSSTDSYASSWGENANTGSYTKNDKVFLSVEGNRSGRQPLDIVELKKATDAGATIITDDSQNRNRSYNIGEKEAEKTLLSSGYEERSPGIWTPTVDKASAAPVAKKTAPAAQTATQPVSEAPVADKAAKTAHVGGTYEVSTKGDKRFSALNATFKEGPYKGRTIEDVYQNDLKGSGKGKPPAPGSPLYGRSIEESYNQYKNLWEQWAKENPELMAELKQKSIGKTLTDSFARTNVSQAKALTDILNPVEKVAPVTQTPTQPVSEAPVAGKVAKTAPIAEHPKASKIVAAFQKNDAKTSSDLRAIETETKALLDDAAFNKHHPTEAIPYNPKKQDELNNAIIDKSLNRLQATAQRKGISQDKINVDKQILESNLKGYSKDLLGAFEEVNNKTPQTPESIYSYINNGLKQPTEKSAFAHFGDDADRLYSNAQKYYKDAQELDSTLRSQYGDDYQKSDIAAKSLFGERPSGTIKEPPLPQNTEDRTFSRTSPASLDMKTQKHGSYGFNDRMLETPPDRKFVPDDNESIDLPQVGAKSFYSTLHETLVTKPKDSPAYSFANAWDEALKAIGGKAYATNPDVARFLTTKTIEGNRFWNFDFFNLSNKEDREITQPAKVMEARAKGEFGKSKEAIGARRAEEAKNQSDYVAGSDSTPESSHKQSTEGSRAIAELSGEGFTTSPEIQEEGMIKGLTSGEDKMAGTVVAQPQSNTSAVTDVKRIFLGAGKDSPGLLQSHINPYLKSIGKKVVPYKAMEELWPKLESAAKEADKTYIPTKEGKVVLGNAEANAPVYNTETLKSLKNIEPLLDKKVELDTPEELSAYSNMKDRFSELIKALEEDPKAEDIHAKINDAADGLLKFFVTPKEIKKFPDLLSVLKRDAPYAEVGKLAELGDKPVDADLFNRLVHGTGAGEKGKLTDLSKKPVVDSNWNLPKYTGDSFKPIPMSNAVEMSVKNFTVKIGDVVSFKTPTGDSLGNVMGFSNDGRLQIQTRGAKVSETPEFIKPENVKEVVSVPAKESRDPAMIDLENEYIKKQATNSAMIEKDFEVERQAKIRQAEKDRAEGKKTIKSRLHPFLDAQGGPGWLSSLGKGLNTAYKTIVPGANNLSWGKTAPIAEAATPAQKYPSLAQTAPVAPPPKVYKLRGGLTLTQEQLDTLKAQSMGEADYQHVKKIGPNTWDYTHAPTDVNVILNSGINRMLDKGSYEAGTNLFDTFQKGAYQGYNPKVKTVADITEGRDPLTGKLDGMTQSKYDSLSRAWDDAMAQGEKYPDMIAGEKFYAAASDGSVFGGKSSPESKQIVNNYEKRKGIKVTNWNNLAIKYPVKK